MLDGKRILVVEDEPIVAMMLEDMLADMGCVVVGPAARVAEAVALAEAEAIDAAILDVNIKGGCSYPVADRLRLRGIPYLFATGYGLEGRAAEHAEVPVLQKPYQEGTAQDALRRLLAPA